jgi:hypothetical protein
MDILTFFAELAKALAWPAIAGASLWMFGGELLLLLKQVTKIKIGNVELERQVNQAAVALTKAEEELIRADAKSETIAPAPAVDGPDVLTATAVIGPIIEPVDRQLAFAEPVAATLLAWMNIEKALKHVVRVNNVSANLATSNTFTMVMGLHYNGFFDRNTWDAIKNLQEVRNKLAHGEGSIDSSAATQYVESADRLVKLLLNSRPKQFVVN